MDNIKPVLTVSQSAKVNELVNLTNTRDSYTETSCTMISKEHEIRLLHHNVQSLSNKLLDIAIMLTTEHSNINILCFTEHWLSEAQLKVLNVDDFRLVSNFSRSHSASGGSCVCTRNTIEIKEVNYLKELGKERFLKYVQLNCLIMVPY
jgi:hypothetical protein